VGGYFFYTLFSINRALSQKVENLKCQLKDTKSRVKGLRIQVQEQNVKLKKLESEIAKKDEENSQHLSKCQSQIEQLESEKQSIEGSFDQLKKQKLELEKNGQSLKNELDELTTKLESQATEKEKPSSDISSDNYKELYYDLKNAIAYSMSGGEQALNMLRDRLIENGNMTEGEELDEFKQRYNSLGEMVGLVVDVEIFDEDEKEVEAEVKAIEQAETLIESIDESLKNAKDFSEIDISNLEFTQQEMDRIVKKLDQVTGIKNQLTTDLEKTLSQLRAFIAKAHMFQAQKEQIRMHKGTEKQLHRNLSNLGDDYRQLARRVKTLSARNDILTTQLNNSTQDKDSVTKLNKLRESLESKEEIMDRLIIEKEMLEQQYLAMSEEIEIDLESGKVLQRLESEHQLLEQQFIELLNELESKNAE